MEKIRPKWKFFAARRREKLLFCGFFVLFPCFSPTRIYGQNVSGSASQVSPEEERSGGRAVPVCFRLVKKLSGCLFDFFGSRVRRLFVIEAASRGEWTILEGMGLTF
ncbi:MAG: hypothetical protein KH071_06470 [Paraprevotella sp.]|uniref:hypothetical protein n=1 Tax=Paraprevotella sp. TaxID=2049036 RepID=UPI00257F1E99|nr:hypothetical protein [Paraprevotella sp.]MBS4807529.1 hypothetical protein [Paraprevotella sp.]